MNSNIRDIYEGACRSIHEIVEEGRGDYWDKRLTVASLCGYMDAKFMRHMHETFGMAICDQVIHIITKTSLEIPWKGLKDEFLMLGTKESAIESMLNEAREFERIAQQRKVKNQ
jgi:hypothetical protein